MKAKVIIMCITKILLIIIGCSVLTSYSGQWEVFTNKNDVRDIALSGNTLWAATTGGVVAWNLNDNSYRSYTTADGLASCDINQVAIDKKGRPWVATKYPAGLFVYENRAWKRMNVGGANNDNVLKYEFISGLEVDRFGNIWVDSYPDFQETNLWRYDGRIWHKHKGVNGPLALDLQKNLIAVDSLFEIAITLHFRIVSFNGSEFVSKWRNKVHFGTDLNILLINMANLAMDWKGNLWISYRSDRFNQTYGVVCNNTLYTTLDGLADDNVSSITTDESGTVWFATDGGISRFNGNSWETYDTARGVASNITYRILTGSNNTLYAATSKGISILKSNQWKTLTTISEPLHSNYTDIYIDKRDAVILAGHDHITIYNDLQWKMNYFRNIRVGGFIKSKDGTLYAIGNEIGKGCILKHGTGGSAFFKILPYTTEKNNRFQSPAVASSGDDPCFWLTDNDNNLIFLNKQTSTTFPPSRFGFDNLFTEINCMLLDRDGRSVWVGYATSDSGSPGIVHFDGDMVKKRISKSDGLASTWMKAIARDSSKNLWFASWDGVAVLRDTKLTTYLKDSDGKVLGTCYTLFVDKSGTVWTHTENGIARFNGSSWKLFDGAAISPDLPYARYSYIIQDRSGTVWFGTSGSGVLAYKDNRWYQFTTRDGIPGNEIRGCALDSKDNLWILTDNGVAMRKFDGVVHNGERLEFLYPRKKQKIKQHGNRFYFSSKDKPKMIRYTLFDLRGRVVLSQTINHRKSFMLPEKRLGPGLRILSIILEYSDEYQEKYFFKMGDHSIGE